MWVIVIGAVVAAVAVAVGAVLVRRPRSGDLHSVQHYTSALGTLEHLSEQVGRPVPVSDEARAPAAPVASPGPGAEIPRRSPETPRRGSEAPRFYRRPDAEGPELPGAAVGTAPHPPAVGDRPVADRRRSAAPWPPAPPPQAPGNRRLPAPGTPLVFDDSVPSDASPAAPPGEPAAFPHADRAERHALESMNRGPRRSTALIAALIVVLLFGALAYIGSRHSGGHHHAADAARHSATTTTSRPVHRHRATSPGHTATTSPTSPTTTVPVTQLGSSTATTITATFPVPSPSYTVILTASGPCWVSVTSSATGTTLWTGTMQAGQVQAVPAQGTTIVELGSSAVALTVNRLPVVFPTPMNVPFTATFAPGTPVAPTTTTPAPTPKTPTPKTTAPKTTAGG